MLIRVFGVIGVAISGSVLLAYECLSKTERQRADAAATEAANVLITLAMGQIPPNHGNRLHQLFRDFN